LRFVLSMSEEFQLRVFSGSRVFSKSKVKKVKLFIAKKQFESATVFCEFRKGGSKRGGKGAKGLKVL